MYTHTYTHPLYTHTHITHTHTYVVASLHSLVPSQHPKAFVLDPVPSRRGKAADGCRQRASAGRAEPILLTMIDNGLSTPAASCKASRCQLLEGMLARGGFKEECEASELAAVCRDPPGAQEGTGAHRCQREGAGTVIYC